MPDLSSGSTFWTSTLACTRLCSSSLGSSPHSTSVFIFILCFMQAQAGSEKEFGTWVMHLLRFGRWYAELWYIPTSDIVHAWGFQCRMTLSYFSFLIMSSRAHTYHNQIAIRYKGTRIVRTASVWWAREILSMIPGEQFPHLFYVCVCVGGVMGVRGWLDLFGPVRSQLCCMLTVAISFLLCSPSPHDGASQYLGETPVSAAAAAPTPSARFRN